MTSIEAMARKKRVARLKKIILITLTVLILLPNIVCICLLVRQSSLKHEVAQLKRELTELENQLAADRAENQGMPSTETVGIMDSSAAVSPMTGEVTSDGKSQSSDSFVESESTDSLLSVEDQTEWEHAVYLTFDDGPSIYTDEILDILKEYDVKATFFVVGKTDEKSLAAYRRIVEEGHTLGMHSYSHRYTKLYASLDSFAEDYTALKELLEETTGVTPSFYRFPGGSSNTVSKVDMHVFADYLTEQDVCYFDWNISIGDAGGTRLSTERLVENAVAGIDRWKTSVILMHDSADKQNTVKALPEIIERLQAMEDTAILPLTRDTELVQHLKN